MSIGLNIRYVTSYRGVIKLLQIIGGIIICSLMCANWNGRIECFGKGQPGYVSGVSFIILVINVIAFVFNLLSVHIYTLERIYGFTAAILLFLAFALMVWLFIADNQSAFWTWIAATGIVLAIAIMFVWDLQILRGEELDSQIC